MIDLPFGEDTNYWQTGKSSPDEWTARAMRQIEAIGGLVLAEGFGSDGGRAAYMIGFELGGERFKVVWPVLPTRGSNVRAARIQAATMLYHHVKAACMSALVLGGRAAFFAHLLLPDGRTAAQVATPELADAMPRLLTGGG